MTAGLTAGCAGPALEEGATSGEQPAASDSSLAGTTWRLVEFQSMDDAIGTTRPDDPSLYTMRLETDNTVSMKLNCNMANGTWTAEPGPDGTSGRFEFGPLATTRALCPPPSLDEQISAQSSFVRSYLMRDGRLHLSLMADGGIFVWEPFVDPSPGPASGTDVQFRGTPDAAIEAAVLRASPDFTGDSLGTLGAARYVHASVDLDGDGRDEVFVYLLGPFFCGTGGCELMLLTGADNGYTVVDMFSISRTPVIVSETTTQGWRDLVRPESGGGAPPSYVRHTFDGTKYVEAERLPADVPPAGRQVLTGDVTYEAGAVLQPRD